MLIVLYALSHLILTITVWQRWCYSHFTDEEPEAERVVWRRENDQSVMELGV